MPLKSERPWYLGVDGDRHGPYTSSEILQWLDEGRISRDDYCWREGYGEWRLIRLVPELSPAVEVQSTPVSGPPASRRRAHVLWLLVPVAVMLLCAAGVGVWFYLGRGAPMPAEMRDCGRLYGEGRVVECAEALAAYFARFDSAMMQDLLQGRTATADKPTPHAEAFLLAGLLALDGNAIVLKTPVKPLACFRAALMLDGQYGGQVVKAIEKRLLICLTRTQEEISVDCHQAAVHYGNAGNLATLERECSRRLAALRAPADTARAELAILEEYSPARAQAMRARIDALAPLDEDTCARIARAMFCAIAPPLAEALARPETRSMCSDAWLRQVYDAYFAQAPLPQGADQCYAGFVRFTQAGAAADKDQAGAKGLSREVLVQTATLHERELLPVVLASAAENGALAEPLVEYASGNEPASVSAGPLKRFSPDASTSVFARMAELLITTVQGHIAQNAAEAAQSGKLEAYCAEHWRAADLSAIAFALVNRKPSLLNQDEFAFAAGFVFDLAERPRNLTRQRPYSLAAYVKQFPKGKSADLAQRLVDANPPPARPDPGHAQLSARIEAAREALKRGNREQARTVAQAVFDEAKSLSGAEDIANAAAALLDELGGPGPAEADTLRAQLTERLKQAEGALAAGRFEDGVRACDDVLAQAGTLSGLVDLVAQATALKARFETESLTQKMKEARTQAEEGHLDKAEALLGEIRQLTAGKPALSAVEAEAVELLAWINKVSDPEQRFVVESMILSDKRAKIWVQDLLDGQVHEVWEGEEIADGYAFEAIDAASKSVLLTKGDDHIRLFSR